MKHFISGICKFIYIYIYIYIHIYTYTHIQIYTYTYMHIYTYTHIHIYIYSYIHIYIYTYIHIYIYTYIHICMILTHTHTTGNRSTQTNLPPASHIWPKEPRPRELLLRLKCSGGKLLFGERPGFLPARSSGSKVALKA